MNQLRVRPHRRTLPLEISVSENQTNENKKNKMKHSTMKKLIPSSKLFSCMLLMYGASFQANAATITWDPIQTATGNASDVVTTGTFVDSAAVYTGANLSLNGVTFKRNLGGDAFDGSNITFMNRASGPSDATGAGGPPVSWDDDYETLARWGIYQSNPGGGVTINLSALTIGQEYLVQLWTGYWDGANWRTEFIAGNSSGLLDQGDPDGSRLSQYVVGSFTADAITQTITATGPDYGIPSFLQVRAVPEPSSALLGGLGLLALLRRRRAYARPVFR